MKAIIAALGFVILVATAILGLRFLNKKTQTSSENTNKAQIEGTSDKTKTAQDIMPLADIKGSVLLQRDGTAIAYVRVHCRNNSLLNTLELVRETEKTATALAAASSWPMKIIRLQRPVDSTKNIESLRAERTRCVSAIAKLAPGAREVSAKRDFMLERIRLLDASIETLEKTQRNGGVARTECYIALPVTLSVANERAAYSRAVDMRASLANAGIESEILDGTGIVNLIQSYMGDFRTSTQNHNPYVVTPLVRGVYKQDKEDSDVIAS